MAWAGWRLIAVTPGERASPGLAAAVAGGEPVEGLALPYLQGVVEVVGDADRVVVVADLGLVVPEHRQPAEAPDTVQPQLKYLAAAPAGDDDRRPDVAQAVVL